jgi:hypothetical protein
MPRAQKVQSAPQEQYGERHQHEQAQREQPLPQVDPMQAAQAMPPVTGVMGQPVDPNLPPTAGMPMGPGPNSVTPPPQAKMRQAEILQLASQLSNNPRLAELANRVAARPHQYMARRTGGTVIRP